MSPADDDPRMFEILDWYLGELHAGRRPERDKLLTGRPELASALDCLDALEGLVPPPPLADGQPCARATIVAQNAPSSGESAVPQPLHDFGEYELLGEIGRGGMGVVYKARQPSLDRTVAIKMILASHLASAEHVRRFQAEARAAASQRHPNIVSIHEVGQVHGQHYFTMDYVEGRSLDECLAEGPLKPESAAHLLINVARAVEHLHCQGIVHRDLKPSNILVDTDGHPYITDFGLAKAFAPDAEMTATGVIAGTPAYMSPEQAAGRNAQIGPATDIYSMGAILYEMLTGQPPFPAGSLIDTLVQVLGAEPTAPRRIDPWIPRSLELICLKCLAKSPVDRYPSAAALADDLARFARGEALSIRPPHLGQRLWRWVRRQPALASRIGSLGLFYLIELWNYSRGGVDVQFHEAISLIVVLWLAASITCQQFLRSLRWSSGAQFAWGTLDSAFLLAVLWKANGAASPLIVGYPLLIVAAGLWFRVRFVWYMTGLSLLSYGVLMWDFYYRRTELQAGFDARFERHVIFALSLVVLGAVVAYLVQRVRDLSGFFGRGSGE